MKRVFAVVVVIVGVLATIATSPDQRANCRSDEECRGSYCSYGRCVECRRVDDCPRQFDCNAGRCEREGITITRGPNDVVTFVNPRASICEEQLPNIELRVVDGAPECKERCREVHLRGAEGRQDVVEGDVVVILYSDGEPERITAKGSLTLERDGDRVRFTAWLDGFSIRANMIAAVKCGER